MDLLLDDIEQKIKAVNMLSIFKRYGLQRIEQHIDLDADCKWYWEIPYPQSHHLDVPESIQLKREIQKLKKNIKLIKKWASMFPVRNHTKEEAEAHSKFIDEYFEEQGG